MECVPKSAEGLAGMIEGSGLLHEGLVEFKKSRLKSSVWVMFKASGLRRDAQIL